MADLEHLSEDALAAYYFDGGGADCEVHLAACAVCRASLEALKADLAAVQAWAVPTLPADYEVRTWRKLVRVEPRLGGSAWKRWFAPRRLALAGALASVIAVAFFAGRFTGGVEPEVARTAPAVVRERILAAALSDHLEESERVLVEIVNGGEFERERAESLLGANRLYRQTAARQGQAMVASVLEDLERVLVEVAHSPSDADSSNLRERVEDQELLFKVRVMELRLREKENRPLRRSDGVGMKG